MGAMATTRRSSLANQPPPLAGHNLFATDRVLVEALAREGGSPWADEVTAFGEALGGSRSSGGGSRTSIRRRSSRHTRWG